MKKILLIVVLLAMLLPTFGQKLNSRGQKMVKCAKDCSTTDFVRFTYSFTYDEQGNMVSARKDNDYSQYWIVEKKDNDLRFISNDISGVWSSCKEDDAPHFTLATNEDGLITRLMVPWYRVDGPKWRYREYKYGKDSKGRNVLLADSISTWFHETGKAPEIEPDHTYYCTMYSMEDGKYQKIRCVRSVNGVEWDGGNDLVYSYEGIKNDTNIPLITLFDYDDEINDLLRLTEWSGIRASFLPTAYVYDGGTYQDYKYCYEDGNLVWIEIYSHGERGRHLYYKIKIEYVEE